MHISWERPPRGRTTCLTAPLGALLLSLLLLAGCATSTGTATLQHSRTTATPQPSFTYVALGASDAFGIGTQDPDRESWPVVLSHELGKPDVHLVNLGIPGVTLGQAQQEELPVALDAHPDVVTIWLAVNDFAANTAISVYSRELTQLLTTLRTQTHARIFVGNLPDLSLLPYFSRAGTPDLRDRVQQWNVAIASVCQAQGVTLVDLYANWSELARHPEYLSGDGLHPSTAGAARLAEVFAAVIRRSATQP